MMGGADAAPDIQLVGMGKGHGHIIFGLNHDLTQILTFMFHHILRHQGRNGGR